MFGESFHYLIPILLLIPLKFFVLKKNVSRWGKGLYVVDNHM